MCFETPRTNVDFLTRILNKLKEGYQQSTPRLCFAFLHHLLKHETPPGRGGSTEDATFPNGYASTGGVQAATQADIPQLSTPRPAGPGMHGDRAGGSSEVGCCHKWVCTALLRSLFQGCSPNWRCNTWKAIEYKDWKSTREKAATCHANECSGRSISKGDKEFRAETGQYNEHVSLLFYKSILLSPPCAPVLTHQST